MNSILYQRLHNQLLLDHDFQSPEELVRHMLCMQSQDFKQHLRAISSRCGCSRSDIEQAYNNGSIVKGWTQRGTIHCIAAEDFQRMTKLCASKTLNGFAKRRAFLGITDQIIIHAEEIIRKFLTAGAKSREEISDKLKESGIALESGWNYHILCYLGSQRIIVQGPIINGDHAFALTDQWIKNTKEYSEDEALRQLCIRYFTSHGPATLADLQWRSGLGVTALRKGVILAGDELIHDNGYYYSNNLQTSRLPIPSGSTLLIRRDKPVNNNKIHFLAGYDERLLGYKDRSTTLHNDHQTLVDVSRNGVFKPTIMIDGITIGTWNTNIAKKKNTISISLFPEYKKMISLDLFKSCILSYETYCDSEFEVQII